MRVEKEDKDNKEEIEEENKREDKTEGNIAEDDDELLATMPGEEDMEEMDAEEEMAAEDLLRDEAETMQEGTILPGLGTAHASWPSAKSARKLAFGHNNPTVCSLACRWQLRLAPRADRESFSIDNPRGRQLKARLYSSELSYRTVVLQFHQ